MTRFLDHIFAGAARWHANRVYRGFLRDLSRPVEVQRRALIRALAAVRESEFGRQAGLRNVRSLAELRRAVPLVTYEEMRPLMDRVVAGEFAALFSPGVTIQMFATSSGTTAKQKLIPVTTPFVSEYRRGWNTFGLKMLTDHPRAILRDILQSSGRYDERITPSGVPAGAITGLLARMQKGIVRRYYVGTPDLALVADPIARAYCLARFALVRDVAFAVTANPATLIRLAQIVDENAEALLRDIHDGTLDAGRVGDPALHRRLGTGLRAAPARAAELAGLRAREGALRPRDYWKLEFLACWTGGSMGHYLNRLADWYGPIPVRDVGLLASEGRVSIPLDDGTPAGPLDLQASCFEFIPAEHVEEPQPETVAAEALETGREYAVVLTNDAGLVRYRLDDVIRVRGRIEQTPVVEFLYRAGRVASVAGEKLTENQLVEAVRQACQQLRIPEFDFVAGPVWSEPPYYRLYVAGQVPPALAAELDQALGLQNEEYASRRKSFRLGPLQVQCVSRDAFVEMDHRAIRQRGSTAEQYKRICLFPRTGGAESALGLADQAVAAP
ncbi:MAG: GH3 auxin-responsive promoter family protein [Phycisphaerales bacterium]|nr:GH3 auxin-responsive promoter family protein [Phycisphaerales bacterium]